MKLRTVGEFLQRPSSPEFGTISLICSQFRRYIYTIQRRLCMFVYVSTGKSSGIFSSL